MFVIHKTSNLLHILNLVVNPPSWLLFFISNRGAPIVFKGFLVCLVKALVNEDTLLRTHCCPWCFLRCANWGTFVADTKCFWTKSETFLCPGHKICVRNKCCARGQTGKHLCRQQCVRNNVSSFARAFMRLRRAQDILRQDRLAL